jgi:hypothetical protein
MGFDMKRLLLLALVVSFSTGSMAFEILAIGTSNTNCRGVDRDKTFPAHLEELLRADGIDATVINGGVDGDKPFWMVNRIFGIAGVLDRTKLVIFEPGPNDRNKSSNVQYSEKILAQLQERKIPTIYVSHGQIQSREEAETTARKHGAYYYGGWATGVPRDKIHRQYDMGEGDRRPGHMTAEGCQLWAKNMLPLVKRVLLEKVIK